MSQISRDTNEMRSLQKPRKCPECKTEMQKKAVLRDSDGITSYVFYQCPKCKNIEICQDDKRVTSIRKFKPA